MPLAKAAPVPQSETTPAEPSPTPRYSSFEYDGIPIDVYQMFGMPMEKSTKQGREELKDIYNWASEGIEDKTLGNVMSRIDALELALGTPRAGETRRGRLWGWLKLKRQINDMTKRQRVLER